MCHLYSKRALCTFKISRESTWRLCWQQRRDLTDFRPGGKLPTPHQDWRNFMRQVCNAQHRSPAIKMRENSASEIFSELDLKCQGSDLEKDFTQCSKHWIVFPSFLIDSIWRSIYALHPSVLCFVWMLSGADFLYLKKEKPTGEQLKASFKPQMCLYVIPNRSLIEGLHMLFISGVKSNTNLNQDDDQKTNTHGATMMGDIRFFCLQPVMCFKLNFMVCASVLTEFRCPPKILMFSLLMAAQSSCWMWKYYGLKQPVSLA